MANNNHRYQKGDKIYIAQCTDQIPDMQALVGTICTISEQTDAHWNSEWHLAYRLEEDKQLWYWQEEWLEPVTEIEVSEDDVMSVFMEL